MLRERESETHYRTWYRSGCPPGFGFCLRSSQVTRPNSANPRNPRPLPHPPAHVSAFYCLLVVVHDRVVRGRIGNRRGARRVTAHVRYCTTSMSCRSLAPHYVYRTRRVVTTVGRVVCSREKSSKPRAKEFADAVPLRFTVSDQKWGLPPGALQSRFLVRRSSSKPFRRYAFLELRKRWSTAEHRRGIWIEGRGDAPIALL